MEYGNCGAKIIKYLLENGGDPNQELADTTLFDYVSWGLVRWGEFYKNRVQCWLVLLAYGGTPSDESFSIKLKEGFDIRNLLEYEKYTYDAVNLEPGKTDINYNLHCRLTIYDENHEVVATLE
jgi:hypothetical protein